MTDPERPDLEAWIARLQQPTPGTPYDSSDDDPEIPQSRAWNIREAAKRDAERIPYRYRDAEADRTELLAWIEEYLRAPRDCPSLLVGGPTGTGKTHAAYGALRLLGRSGRRVIWHATSAPELYASLRPRAGVVTEQVFERYASAPLLFLDDLGTAKPSEWVEEITYRLIDHRYVQCLPSIITTNVAPKELSARLGERVASRLVESSRWLILAGDDRRRGRAA